MKILNITRTGMLPPWPATPSWPPATPLRLVKPGLGDIFALARGARGGPVTGARWGQRRGKDERRNRKYMEYVDFWWWVMMIDDYRRIFKSVGEFQHLRERVEPLPECLKAFMSYDYVEQSKVQPDCYFWCHRFCKIQARLCSISKGKGL